MNALVALVRKHRVRNTNSIGRSNREETLSFDSVKVSSLEEAASADKNIVFQQDVDIYIMPINDRCFRLALLVAVSENSVPCTVGEALTSLKWVSISSNH